MDVTMSWLSLFCFGYTYYELCTTIKLDISNWIHPIGYIQLDISNRIYPIGYIQLDIYPIGYIQLDIFNWIYPIGYIQLDISDTADEGAEGSHKD